MDRMHFWVTYDFTIPASHQGGVRPSRKIAQRDGGVLGRCMRKLTITHIPILGLNSPSSATALCRPKDDLDWIQI